MKKLLLLLILCSFGIRQGITQNPERYLDPFFTNVEIETNIIYGVNATVLLIPLLQTAVPQPLLCDVYTPAGDNDTSRPLILFFHSGNFLPFPQNRSVSGTRTDSTVVEFCTRLAKMGYVVASVDNRLGWDPINPSQAVRTSGIINAAYRGVQDANTCIRYFKKTFVEGGNRFGIDTSKIVLWGQGTGGYIAINCNALDTYNKIPTATDGKFLITIPPSTIIPMIIPVANGDVEGKTFGVTPTGLGKLWGTHDGDTLCYPNHVDYSSEFQLGVNMSGCVGDSAWLEPGQKPLISFHTPADPFAPCGHGLVIVPVTPPLAVVEVDGSCTIQAFYDAFGNNKSFTDQSQLFNDPHTIAANKLNNGHDGLYLMPRANIYDSSPWDFWSPDNPNDTTGRKTNPDMTPEKARLYIDTIIAYTAPRACLALDLGCDLSRYTIGTKNLAASSVGLEISPNPAQDAIHISTFTEFPILSAQLMDINGKIYRTIEKINSNRLTINRSNLNSGFYMVRLHFEKGETFSKIVFK